MCEKRSYFLAVKKSKNFNLFYNFINATRFKKLLELPPTFKQLITAEKISVSILLVIVKTT